MTPVINFGNWLRRVCPWIRKSTAHLTEDGSEPELEKLFLQELSENGVEQDEFIKFMFNVGRLTIAAIPGVSTVAIISEEGYLGELPSKYGSLLWAEVSRQEEANQRSRVKKMLEARNETT